MRPCLKEKNENQGIGNYLFSEYLKSYFAAIGPPDNESSYLSGTYIVLGILNNPEVKCKGGCTLEGRVQMPVRDSSTQGLYHHSPWVLRDGCIQTSPSSV